jgi:hypothetical protein
MRMVGIGRAAENRAQAKLTAIRAEGFIGPENSFA